MKTISASDLEGSHILTTAAVLSRAINPGCDEESDVLAIAIDGNTYTFYEDGNDGYRSYMGEVQVEEGLNLDKLHGASIIGRPVVIKHHTSNTNFTGECDLIEIIDVETGHIWAFLGTENIDDYYPGCIMDWRPLDPKVLEKIRKRPLRPIPIEAAEEIANTYGYDQVLIFARRVGQEPNPYGEHMTTYGINSTHCEIAARMGKTLQTFMGWEVD